MYHGRQARRINVPGGATMQFVAADFGDESITIHFQNFHNVPGFPAPVVEIRTEVSGGQSAGSLMRSSIGPGEAVRFRVTGATTVFLTNITAVAVDIGVWTDETPGQLKVPGTSGTIALGAGVFTPLPPGQGWSPAYKRWFSLVIQPRFDLRFVDDTGAVVVQYAGFQLLTPLIESPPFFLPTGHSVEIQVVAPTRLIVNWTELRSG